MSVTAHTPTVKDLVWQEYPTGTWKANTPFGSEYTIKNEGKDFWLVGRVLRTRFDGLESAKAQAQADYSKRVLSALKGVTQ